MKSAQRLLVKSTPPKSGLGIGQASEASGWRTIFTRPKPDRQRVSLKLQHNARMPSTSRKRNKGQSRKLRQQQRQDELLQWITEGCTHGCPPRPHPGHLLQKFIHTWHKQAEQLPRLPNATSISIAAILKAMILTHDQCPGIWDNESDRELARRYFVSHGTKAILDANLDHAKAAVLTIKLLENYIPNKEFNPRFMLESDGDFMKVKDAIGGCHRSLVRFFKMRVHCSCLDEIYVSSKSLAKMGICDGCRGRKPRKDLMTCTRCNTTQYCSSECQLSHWPVHKEYCNCMASK